MNKADKMRKEKKWGHFGDYQTEYSHFLNEETKTILIGVSNKFLEAQKEQEEEFVWADGQEGKKLDEQLLVDLSSCSDLQADLHGYWSQYFQLPHVYREILIAFMEELGDKVHLHEGAIWRAVAGFITTRNDVGLKRIAEMFSPFLRNQYNSEGVERRCYDRLKKAFDRERITEGDLKTVLRSICAFYLITPQILTDGIGYCYCLKDNPSDTIKACLERYTVKAVWNAVSKNPDVSVEKVITEITGLPAKALDRYPVKVACKYYTTDKQTQFYLDCLFSALRKGSQK